MTQSTLAIALVKFMDSSTKCTFKPASTNWRANLTGNSTTLGNNLGAKPNATKESQLSIKRWPSQAHHLIPHKTLKEHPVAKWLKKGEKLYADTKYNVDHENNGKWMPYASGLQEWVTGARRVADLANNKKLIYKVMRLSNIQLHQGRHSGSNRYGIGEAPYKERVKLYLKKINKHSISHYAGQNKCTDCSGKKQSGKFPPRENIVRYVDRASKFIKNDIESCRIFVSKIAAEYQATVGFK
jgi:hypothetical protein